MATTTIPPRTRRSPEEWRAVAMEVLPQLQGGQKISNLRETIGSNGDALRVALAQQGYDPSGQPMRLKEITASTPRTLAKRVAQRRQDGAPWWLIQAETDKSYGELNRLLREHGYAGSGENGASAA